MGKRIEPSAFGTHFFQDHLRIVGASTGQKLCQDYDIETGQLLGSTALSFGQYLCGYEKDLLLNKFNPEGKLTWKRKTSLNIRAMRIIEHKVIALGCNDNYQLTVEDYHSSRELLMRTQLYPQWINQNNYNDEFWIDSSGNVFTFPRNNSILNKMGKGNVCL